ncbi:NAD(P)-dependent oxidoreductase [Candidatus Aerophobetes bacterium]|nr:NAD(P)-dependent oxidoreductase [Candidatus Aerophobetes bacterium]
MAVVITGGYGLLGSHLVLKFVKEGNRVIIIDTQKRDIDYLKEVEKEVLFVQADVTDFVKLTQIFLKNKEKIEGIVHTVSLMPSPFLTENPYTAIRVNVTGTCNMLEIARLFEIKKFLYISSGAVYGETEDIPSELTHPISPSDLYGATKASCEVIGREYERNYGIDFRCARPYFFFGPGRLPSEQTYLFKRLLAPLEGLEGLELARGKDQRLGFTYIKDIAKGCYLIYQAEKLKHKTFNIATDKSTSFSDMVKLAQKYSDTPTEVKIGPGKFMPRGETLDISLARKELGFYPEYTIEEAMKEYAEWVKKNKRNKKT